MAAPLDKTDLNRAGGLTTPERIRAPITAMFGGWNITPHRVNYQHLTPPSDKIQRRAITHLRHYQQNTDGSTASIWLLEPRYDCSPGLALKAARKHLPQEQQLLEQTRKQFRIQAQQVLEHEATMLQQINHCHIIDYFGAFEHPDWGCVLTLERMGGDLVDLSEQFHNCLPLNILVQIGQETINALSWLHNEKGLVHGDIHDGNVLFKSLSATTYCFKLGDMGSCLEKSLPCPLAEVPFLPPEVSTAWISEFPNSYTSQPKANPATDIWAFGAMMLRITLLYEYETMKIKLHQLAQASQKPAKEGELLLTWLAHEARMERLGKPPTQQQPDTGLGKLFMALSGCQNLVPDTRPTAAKISERLEQILAPPALNQPPQPTVAEPPD